MKASDLERLIFTPFHTSKVIHHFLSGAETVNKEIIKTELIYLVLPFIYYNQTSEKLQNLNKASKFSAFIEKNNFNIFLSSLNEKINSYRKLTNEALIILSNEIELEFGKFIRLDSVIHYQSEENIYLKKIYKSAFNLGILLGKEQYLSIFKKLNITAI